MHKCKARRSESGEPVPPKAPTRTELSAWKKADLTQELRRRGLGTDGLKAALVERLLADMQADAAAGGGAAASPAPLPPAGTRQGGDAGGWEGAEDLQRWAGRGGGGGDAPSGGGLPDAERAALLAELGAVVGTLPQEDLAQALQERALPSGGAKEQLVARLVASIAEGVDNERLRAMLAADEGEEGDAPLDTSPAATGGVDRGYAFDAEEEEAAAAAAAAPPPPPPRRGRPPLARGAAAAGGEEVRALDAERREYLLADQQQKLLAQLQEVPTDQLVADMRAAGEPVADTDTREELLERLSWALAETYVGAAAPAVADAGAPPAARERAKRGSRGQEVLPLDAVPGVGAVPEGSALREAYATAVKLNLQTVRVMARPTMEACVQAMGLIVLGGRYEIRDRLMAALEVYQSAASGKADVLASKLAKLTLRELEQELDRRGIEHHGQAKWWMEEALGSAMLTETGWIEAGGPGGQVPPALKDLPAWDAPTERVARDPPCTLALLAGGSSAAERASALASARALAECMHTAPLAAPGGGGGGGGAEGEEAASGVAVELFWLHEDGVVYRFPAGAIAAMSPESLPGLLASARGAATLPSASLLAAALSEQAASRPTAALPLGGGDAVAAAAAAAAAAGVAVVGAPPDVVSNLSDKWEAARWVSSHGFPTLPMLHVLPGDWGSETGASDEHPLALSGSPAAAAAAAAALQPPPPAAPAEGEEGEGEFAWASVDDAPVERMGEGEKEASLGEEAAAVAARLSAWCGRHGWRPDAQVFVIKPARGACGAGISYAKGVRRAAAAIGRALGHLPPEGAGGAGDGGAPPAEAAPPTPLGALVVEPYAGASMLQWSCVVVEAPGGQPLALMPTQVELYQPAALLHEHRMHMAEWEMMKEGVAPSEIASVLEKYAVAEPDALYATYTDRPLPLPGRTVKHLCPPPISERMTLTLKHAAAKAFQALGLRGIARVDGWLDLDPSWEAAYKLPPMDTEPLPDEDPDILRALAQRQADADAATPAPLAAYYDHLAALPDLSKFDQAARLTRAGNGEGGVMLAGVTPLVGLHRGSLALVQAAQLGISPAALARHLVNTALSAAAALVKPVKPVKQKPRGTEAPDRGAAPHLPSSPPADLSTSVLWSPQGYALVPVQEQTRRERQMAEAAVLVPELAAYGTMQQVPPDVTEALRWQVLDVIAGPPVDSDPVLPESWQPEVDGRTQEEIHAEADASLGEARAALREGYSLPLDLHEPVAVALPPLDATRAAAERVVAAVAAAREEHEVARALPSAQPGGVMLPARGRRKVWVLVGGDGEERQAALAAGAHVAAQLSRYADLEVEVFLLPPPGAGANEVARRAELIARRRQWLEAGVPEAELVEDMTEEGIRNPSPPDYTLPWQMVWALTPAALQRHSVEAVVEAAESLTAAATTAYWGMTPRHRAAVDAQRSAMAEAAAVGLPGVAGDWGGHAEVALPLPPRPMNVEAWVDEAAKAAAAVYLLLPNATATVTGQLQQMLVGAGVPFTGLPPELMPRVSNRLALADELREMEGSGVSVPPHALLPVDTLFMATDWEHDAEASFESLRSGWGGQGDVTLKPPAGGGCIGVARIGSAADLAAYAQCLTAGLPQVPAHLLGRRQPGASGAVTLPSVPDFDELLVEPWIETDPVEVLGPGGEDGAPAVSWAGEHRWVEVTIGLLGDVGTMSAMTPTVLAHTPRGEPLNLTPPPASILPRDVVLAAQQRAQAVADRLALRGLMQLDGFVSADTGDLIVMDVKEPKMVEGHPLLAQALLEDPPLLPHQLFRRQLALASAAVEAAAAAGGALGVVSAWYDEAGGEAAGASGSGTSDLDFDLEGPVGLPLTGVAAPGGRGGGGLAAAGARGGSAGTVSSTDEDAWPADWSR